MLHKIASAAMAAALLGTALPALAAETPDGWDYGAFETGDGCFVARPTPKNVTVGFHSVPSNNREFRVVFFSPDWDSLQPLVGKTMPVELLMATPGGDRRISTDTALVIQVAGGIEAVVAIWYGDEADQLRKTVRTASNITLIGQGKEVGTYSLSGLPAGLDAMAASCASASAK